MDLDCTTTANAVYVERLQQAVRVMEGLSETERTNFTLSVYAVQSENGIRACVAGYCGLDAWFQGQGFITTVGEEGGSGYVIPTAAQFFGTKDPFYRPYYGSEFAERSITVDDAIAALRRAIDSFEVVPQVAEAVSN